MSLNDIKWDSNGLIPVVAQSRTSGEIRMVAYANREALEKTCATGEAHFFSRSRGQLWKKGETSGNRLQVVQVWADCDADAVIYLVDAEGPSCHTGAATCFFSRLDRDEASGLAEPSLPSLFRELLARKDSTAQESYTRSLLDAGVSKIGDKVREEAGEFVDALGSESDERVVSEAADVLYHLLVGLLARNLDVRAVLNELDRRRGVSGHAEKASRKR